ncbi:hypothetical protein AAG570_008633 [Ranatra chinensis]|uniref:Uncharacterized protein n=1 Tax=Ranatra chinensis TaxID=642074 RepID=A0ABD0YRG4_9HEMI
MASKRLIMFQKNKKQETTEIGYKKKFSTVFLLSTTSRFTPSVRGTYAWKHYFGNSPVCESVSDYVTSWSNSAIGQLAGTYSGQRTQSSEIQHSSATGVAGQAAFSPCVARFSVTRFTDIYDSDRQTKPI